MACYCALLTSQLQYIECISCFCLDVFQIHATVVSEWTKPTYIGKVNQYSYVVQQQRMKITNLQGQKRFCSGCSPIMTCPE